jgi:YndJ-like protein
MNSIDHWTTLLLISIGIAATVSIGLPLVTSASERPRPWVLGTAIVSALISLMMPPGAVASVLALPWLGVATLVTYRTASRRLIAHTGPRWAVVTWLPVLALGWWATAALWLVAHRAGIEPLGFDRATTVLTVGHFHHAGFGLTALMVATCRRLADHRRAIGVAIAHQIGMVTVAMGITFDDHLEVIGATLITVALGGWAAMVLGPVRSATSDAIARRFLTVSAVAWFVPMGLAIGWALGPFLSEPVVATFRVMLGFHAAINAIGLVLCGLIALRRLANQPPVADHRLPTPTMEDHRDLAHQADH